MYFGLENEEKTYVGITRQELSRRRYQHNHFGGKNFSDLKAKHNDLTRNGIKNKYHDAAEEWAANYIDLNDAGGL